MENPPILPVVLVIDDTPQNLTLMVQLLSDRYTIKVASNGEKGLKVAQASPTPDLILLDIMMPDMDGFEVCRRLKDMKQTRNIPVIFLTAKTQLADEKQGFELGAVDYITKPISPPILEARVHTHLALKAAADFLSDRNEYLEQEVQRRTLEAMQQAEEARALRDRQAALVQSERLASLGSLVVGISHELNTPLGNAVLSISTLSRQIQTLARSIESGNLRRSTLSDFTVTATEAVYLIEKSIARSLALVGEFKDSAMGETVETVSEFELAEITSALLSDMAEELDRCHIQVQVQIPPGLVMYSYAQALGQVIRQLVMNVALHAYAENQHGTLQLTAQQESDHALALYVSDSGVGIAQEKLARVFDPFYTTRRGPGSKGLGLTLVQRLTSQLLGGTVDLRSTPGLGTQVTLKLPLSAPLSS